MKVGLGLGVGVGVGVGKNVQRWDVGVSSMEY